MLFLVLAVVFGCFIAKEIWMRWHYDIHKIPSPPAIPFLGHALHFWMSKSTPLISVWIKKQREKLGYPRLMRLCLLGKTSVIVADINLVRNVVLLKKDGLLKGGRGYLMVQRLLMGDDRTPCLVTTPRLDGPYVKTIRRVHMESMTGEGLRALLPKQVEAIKKTISLVECRRNEGTIDVQDLFTKLTLDVILKAGMDLDFGVMENSTPLYNLIISCGRHIRALSIDPFLKLKTRLFPQSTFAKRVRQDFQDLQNEWHGIAAEIDSRNEPKPKNITFWANLKRARMPGTNDPLPFNLLRGELATVIVGGMDTTGHQLGWIFALLASNPQVVEKLLDEFQNHGLYGPEARDPNYEDLNSLKYLSAVVKEGLRRMHVMVFTGQRTTPKDITLDGFRIPKGSIIIVPSGSTMNSENDWEDHLAFTPERWLDSPANVSEKFYIPFSLGERDCTGRRLAIQTIKLVVLFFIRDYTFELKGETIDSLEENSTAGIVLEARNGISLSVTPRTQASKQHL